MDFVENSVLSNVQSDASILVFKFGLPGSLWFWSKVPKTDLTSATIEAVKHRLSQGQRRLAAIMFTDMVGYTALGQRNESLSLALVKKQRNLIRPILGRHNGREVKTMGDAFLVEFPNAVDAVRCGYDIQRTIRESNLSLDPEARINLRIGLHVGEIIESHGDISGDSVNVASRIEHLAEDGGVCMTRQVYDHVKNKVDIPFSNIGLSALKNVAEPIEVYKMVMPWDHHEEVARAQELDHKRIAVLPFANVSPDSADEYFADGLTDEMITELSKIQGLRVIARTSVMHYKDSAKGLREIARELKVASVLEGSVRKAGNKVRITAQLIDSSDEEQLWADKYDRELHDVFEVQGEIAAKVASSLRMKLIPEPSAHLRQTESTEAYTLYLRGRFLWNKRSAEAVREALKYFQEAIAIDPGYAKAYAGIADCYSILVDRNEMAWSEGAPKGRAACEKAVELDATLPEAHASMGLVLMNDLNYAEAEKEFRKAIELNPGYASAYQWYSLMLEIKGRLEEAGTQIAKAEEADPLSPIILHNSGFHAWVNGHDAEAIQKWDRGLEVSPQFDIFHFDLASYYLTKSLRKEAVAELKVLDSMPEWSSQGMAMSTFLHGIIGDREEAERRVVILLSKKGPGQAGQLAWAYAGLGDKDKFYEWLLRSADDRSMFPAWVRLHPLFGEMRADSRFQEFLSKWKV